MRLITRSDFDGLGCAALLEKLGVVEEVFYTHPKDLQDGKIKVSATDVLANVPFVEGCGLWFDHHSSEQERLKLKGKFQGSCEMEPSTARVIYKYYSKDPSKAGQLKRFDEMIAAVDKADAGQYTHEDITNPKGWMLLAFLTDPRTGMGYRHSYTNSNFDLMKSVPEMLKSMTIGEILASKDVQERVNVYQSEAEKFLQFVRTNSRVEGKVLILDFRGAKEIPGGNRFLEYTLFPDQNISVRLTDGKNKEFVMISIGHSVLNRTSKVDVGSLALKYGGGGHRVVGTCQVAPAKADAILKEILAAIQSAS